MYTSLFLDDRLEVFDLKNTKISVSREAVLRGHRCKDGLYRIPLRAADADKLEPLPNISDISQANYDQETMLITIPGLAKPKETIQSVYELRTQQEMVWYYHAAAGFPVKATWIKVISNNQYSSWPGLTADAVKRNFPESSETQKGTCASKKQE